MRYPFTLHNLNICHNSPFLSQPKADCFLAVSFESRQNNNIILKILLILSKKVCVGLWLITSFQNRFNDPIEITNGHRSAGWQTKTAVEQVLGDGATDHASFVALFSNNVSAFFTIPSTLRP